MWATILLFVIGLILLCYGGDLFVDSAVLLARRFRVSPVLIGATIVSIGTTIPEITVSALASARGESQIAYGNALGSVICNTGLIAGILLLLTTATMPMKEIKRGCGFFFAGLALLYGIVAWKNGVDGLGGALLLALLVVYLFVNVSAAKKGTKGQGSAGAVGEDGSKSVLRLLWGLAFGAAIIFVGSNLLVNSGVSIAAAMGVPERVIALTFIALGTSLPELVTAISSIVKGQSGVSLGNIIGANIINLTAVIGASALISPMEILRQTLNVDVLLAAGLMLLMTLPVVFKGKTARWQGLLLVACYAFYVLWLFNGSLVVNTANVFAPYHLAP